MTKQLSRRYARERIFVRLGMASIIVAMLFLFVLLATVLFQGWRTFISASLRLEVYLDEAVIGGDGGESALRYQKVIRNALNERFPDVSLRRDKRELYKLPSFSAAVLLRAQTLAGTHAPGRRATVWLPLASSSERYLKGGVDTALPQQQRGVSDNQIAWLDDLRGGGDTRLSFNASFFTNADSRDAESAGIGGALVGSFYSLLLAFLFSFPTAVLASIYLEMFAPRNRWFDFIEININNLAAVPSIIFGLLGLAVFINFFNMPRSSPLVGGLVLSLMTLPTIIIAARAAIKAVPGSLLAGALSLGATKMQGIFHHVLPNAMPGILTGTIIGMAGALGETAPLLMIGMVAFIVELPAGVADAATALPVQIFLWADSPERGFAERTAAAIVVLLSFLLLMNAAAIVLRKRLEKKW